MSNKGFHPIIGPSVLLAPTKFRTFSQFYDFYNNNNNNFLHILINIKNCPEGLQHFRPFVKQIQTMAYGLEGKRTLLDHCIGYFTTGITTTPVLCVDSTKA